MRPAGQRRLSGCSRVPRAARPAHNLAHSSQPARPRFPGPRLRRRSSLLPLPGPCPPPGHLRFLARGALARSRPDAARAGRPAESAPRRRPGACCTRMAGRRVPPPHRSCAAASAGAAPHPTVALPRRQARPVRATPATREQRRSLLPPPLAACRITRGNARRDAIMRAKGGRGRSSGAPVCGLAFSRPWRGGARPRRARARRHPRRAHETQGGPIGRPHHSIPRSIAGALLQSPRACCPRACCRAI